MITLKNFLGATIAFAGVYKDTNSTYLGNRMSSGGGSCYFLSFTQAYFIMTKFIWNYASVIGGVIGVTQQCFIYMENVLVLGNSAGKGGVISSTESSAIIIKNSNFTQNSAITGGIFHCLENYFYNITIISSNFSNNMGSDNLFNLMLTTIEIIDSIFSDNINTIFSLTQSSLTLNHIGILNHSCNNLVSGCIINSIQYSTVISEDVIISKMNNAYEEGTIYMELSSGTFSYMDFKILANLKSIGSCFDIRSSDLFINDSSFISYDTNCIYAENSTININNGYFNNENAKADLLQFGIKYENLIKNGTIFCESCINFSISNSLLLYNNLSDYGGAITLTSYQNDYNFFAQIYNTSFLENEVTDQGGAVYLSNVNALILNCSFLMNKAKIGAAICFVSLCNFHIICIL